MSRCIVGPRKLLNKIQPLMPEGWTARLALVRGGWEHGHALIFAESPEGERLLGSVNYLKGTKFEVDDPPLNRWS